jgi:hypothetical protein
VSAFKAAMRRYEEKIFLLEESVGLTADCIVKTCENPMNVDLTDPKEYVEHVLTAFTLCTFDEFMLYPWMRYIQGLCE